jgi:hypothetical protein
MNIGRVRLGLVLSLTLFALSVATADSSTGSGRSRPLRGTLVLRAATLGSDCHESAVGSSILAVMCSQSGRFTGTGAAGAAAYSWTWRLDVLGGKIPGTGSQRGAATLHLGTASLSLVTTGTVARVSAPAGSIREESRGSWRLGGGSGRVARAKGSGSYDFVATERRGVSPESYQGTLTLSGTTS